MSSILCCRVQRKASITWLKTTKTPFDFELLFEAYCTACKHDLMASCGFTHAHGRYPQYRIRRKDQPIWLRRKKTDFHLYEPACQRLPKDTRPLVFVGEATLRMARDVARRY